MSYRFVTEALVALRGEVDAPKPMATVQTVDAVVAAGLDIAFALDVAPPDDPVLAGASGLMGELAALAADATRKRLSWCGHELLLLLFRIAAGDPHTPYVEFLFDKPRPRACLEIACIQDDLAICFAEPSRSESESECGTGACDARDAQRRARVRDLFGAVWPECLPEERRDRVRSERETAIVAARRLWGDSDPSVSIPTSPSAATSSALFRAASILARAADDVEAGREIRPDTSRSFADFVVSTERSWAEPWAPFLLFSELGEDWAASILSPATARLARRTERGARRSDALSAVLMHLFRSFDDGDHQRSAMASALLTSTLGERGRPWPFAGRQRNRDTPHPDSLSVVGRTALVAVCESVSLNQWSFDVSHTLSRFGLPSHYLGVRRWLGIDPPGGLEYEIVIDGEPITVGRACEAVLARRFDQHTVSAAMAASLSPRQLVRSTCGFEWHDYDLETIGTSTTTTERAILYELRLAALALGCAKDASVQSLIEEQLEEWLDTTRDIRDCSLQLVLLTRRLAPREELPLRYDKLVMGVMSSDDAPIEAIREIVGALPKARRRDLLIEHTRKNGVFPTLRVGHDLEHLLDDESRAQLADAPPRKVHPMLASFADVMGPMVEMLGEMMPKPSGA